MSNDDLSWLVAQRPSGSGGDREAHDRALMSLLRHASSHPAGGRKRLRLTGLFQTRVLAIATATGAAAIAAAVVLSVNAGPSATVTKRSGGVHGAQAAVHHHSSRRSLVRLAVDLSTTTASGDATLIQRTTHTGGQNVTVYDLYADSGTYYFSRDESGMPAQVSAGDNQGDGVFAREVAAAKEAAAGNVQQGALDLANAPAPNGRYKITSVTDTTLTPAQMAVAKAKGKLLGQPVSTGTNFDNWAWENAQDAMIAGAGDPQVRAGVLKILALLPGVSVSQGTSADGQPTLVLTGGADEVGADYQEQLTINAETGMPIGFVGGKPGGATATQVDYRVARVNLADIAAGKLPSF